MVYIFIQMSCEMWDFDIYGQLDVSDVLFTLNELALFVCLLLND